MILNEFFDMLVSERSKIKSKKHKSQFKIMRENDENASPENSPVKEEHGIQRMKKSNDELGDIYLQEIK
jgi:hypothetical protein